MNQLPLNRHIYLQAKNIFLKAPWDVRIMASIAFLAALFLPLSATGQLTGEDAQVRHWLFMLVCGVLFPFPYLIHTLLFRASDFKVLLMAPITSAQLTQARLKLILGLTLLVLCLWSIATIPLYFAGRFELWIESILFAAGALGVTGLSSFGFCGLAGLAALKEGGALKAYLSGGHVDPKVALMLWAPAASFAAGVFSLILFQASAADALNGAPQVFLFTVCVSWLSVGLIFVFAVARLKKFLIAAIPVTQEGGTLQTANLVETIHVWNWPQSLGGSTLMAIYRRAFTCLKRNGRFGMAWGLFILIAAFLTLRGDMVEPASAWMWAWTLSLFRWVLLKPSQRMWGNAEAARASMLVAPAKATHQWWGHWLAMFHEGVWELVGLWGIFWMLDVPAAFIQAACIPALVAYLLCPGILIGLTLRLGAYASGAVSFVLVTLLFSSWQWQVDLGISFLGQGVVIGLVLLVTFYSRWVLNRTLSLKLG